MIGDFDSPPVLSPVVSETRFFLVLWWTCKHLSERISGGNGFRIVVESDSGLVVLPEYQNLPCGIIVSMS